MKVLKEEERLNASLIFNTLIFSLFYVNLEVVNHKVVLMDFISCHIATWREKLLYLFYLSKERKI